MHNDPAATRTGIVIGGAYVRRLPAHQADPIELHRRRSRVTDLGHRAVVVVGVAILLGFAVAALTGCAQSARGGDSAPPIIASQGFTPVWRYGPDDLGVACYSKGGADEISCVKVR
jgi:hypothetical protein